MGVTPAVPPDDTNFSDATGCVSSAEYR